jgi:hypothetical protein
LYVPGHYETPCGGCDTIAKPDTVYGLVRQAVEAGHDVLFEGVIVQDDVRRCVELHHDFPGAVLVIFLDVDVDQCIASVKARRNERGDDRPFDSSNTTKRAAKMPRMAQRLQDAGIEVRHADRANALDTVLRLLDLPAFSAPLLPAPPVIRTVSRSLPSLAAAIMRAIANTQTAARSALEYAREAGELLNAAQDLVPYGKWGAWLSANCPGVSERMAQHYKNIASRWSELNSGDPKRVSDLPLREAIKLLASPTPDDGGDQGDDDAQETDDDLKLGPGGLAVGVPPVVTPEMTPPTAYVRPVQLNFDGTEYANFAQLIAQLQVVLKTANQTETVAAAVRYAHRALCSAEAIAC